MSELDRTLIPADQFDALVRSLDEPDEAPLFFALAREPRRFVRIDE